MIRPVPNFVLPGIVYAIDRYMRSRHSDYANFVIAQTPEEPRSSLAALRDALLPVAPNAHTWICEEGWHPLGLAQTRARPGGLAWDFTFLAAMTRHDDQPTTTFTQDDVLVELVQYALNAALMRGVQRVFARVEDERSELEAFSKLGFQRYAREATYWLQSTGDAVADVSVSSSTPRRNGHDAVMSLRPWHRHDAWGLLRLYDACTPKRVQMAEGLSSDEFAHTRAGGGRSWYLPLIEPRCVAYVNDRGVRLGGWLRLRLGRGSEPHQLWLMAHPDDPDVPAALVRAALGQLAHAPPRPVICQVREYEGHIVDALRGVGFEHCATHALLVRHLALRALWKREVPAVEPRILYGVKGIGTSPSRLSEGEKTHYATSDH